MKLFKVGSAVLVAIFIIGFLAIRSCEGATTFEMGTVVFNDEASGVVILISEVIADKYAVGVGLLEPDYIKDRSTWEPFMLVQVQRYVTYKRLTLGIGVTYWQNKLKDDLEQFTFTEMIRLNISKSFDVYYRHWSNAGAGNRQLGEDALLFGIRF